jgi:hypothetical protein
MSDYRGRVYLKSVTLALALFLSGQSPFAFAEGAPPKVQNECDLTGGNSRYAACPSPAVTDSSQYQGVRSDQDLTQAAVPIDIQTPTPYNMCRYVENQSTGTGTSIFVPLNSLNEWQQFYLVAPKTNTFLNVYKCSRPYTSTTTQYVPPPTYSADCTYTTTWGDGQGDQYTPQVYAIYTKANPPIYPFSPNPPQVAQFSCYNGATIVNAGVTWQGMNSDPPNYATSWTQQDAYGPNVTLTMTSGEIGIGQSTTLTWVVNASTCTASGGYGFAGNVSATGGQQVVGPFNTQGNYPFSINCISSNGQSSVASLNLSVGPLPTVSVNGNPNPVTLDGSTTLTWSSTNANSCTATWTSSQATSGSQLVSPVVQTTTYTMTCYNDFGQGQGSVKVVVNAAACGVDEGTPSPNGPWNDNPNGLCSPGGNDASNESYGGGNWSWTCPNVTGACTAPIQTPTFKAGCAVVQKEGGDCGELRANNEKSATCEGAYSTGGDQIVASVGMVCAEETNNCEPFDCGDKWQWNLGEWYGEEDEDIYEYANDCETMLSSGTDWSKSSRFTFTWTGDLGNFNPTTSDQFSVSGVANGKYTENVKVTDTYNGVVINNLSVNVNKNTVEQCPPQ